MFIKKERMSENAIFYPLLALTMAIVLGYLNKGTKKDVSSDQTGKYRLRMQRFYQIIGVVAIGFGVLFVVGPLLLEDEMDLAAYVIFFLCVLIFGGIGLLFVRQYKNHQVVFDDTVIEVRTVSGKISFMRWEDVASAKFNGLTGLITLKDKAGNKIKIHQHLFGLSKFMNLLEQKTGLTVKEIRFPR